MEMVGFVAWVGWKDCYKGSTENGVGRTADKRALWRLQEKVY